MPRLTNSTATNRRADARFGEVDPAPLADPDGPPKSQLEAHRQPSRGSSGSSGESGEPSSSMHMTPVAPLSRRRKRFFFQTEGKNGRMSSGPEFRADLFRGTAPYY